MHYKQLCGLLLCMVIAMGCGKQASQADKQQPATQPAAEGSQAQKTPPPSAPSKLAVGERPEPARSEPAKSSSDGDFRPPMPPQPPSEPARTGVGQLGSEIADGPLGTPVKALFRVQETLAFMRLKQPMEIYRAIHGHYPKSHEEFFEEIVKRNNIRLPPLPEGTRYLYDAQMAAEMSSYDVDNPPLRVVRQ